MRILLTGVMGQVGWELQRTLMTIGEVIPTAKNAPTDGLALDLSNPESIRLAVRETKPNLIVNAGAYTAVDKAETEVELAMAVNAIAPAVLAEEAKRLDATLVHYSTDYVFNGQKLEPYTEQDAPSPLGIYGDSKLKGEQAIQESEVPHFIFRTSWVYGSRGRNFFKTMLKLAQEKEELKVVNDQIGAPTWSRTIAEVTAQILAQDIYTKAVWDDFMYAHTGLYHLTSTDETTWYGFAKAIFDGARSEPLKLQQCLPIATSDYPTPAKRPLNSRLNTRKISQTFGIALPSWKTALSAVLLDY
jgi:dTDP-4-dehydrorhamnose reductase